MYDCVTGCGVDPRSLAGRIMDIRSQLASEFVQDLKNVAEARARALGRSGGRLGSGQRGPIPGLRRARAACSLRSARRESSRMLGAALWRQGSGTNVSSEVRLQAYFMRAPMDAPGA
jgi:hypothetical protein